jgi:hypothetical protein
MRLLPLLHIGDNIVPKSVKIGNEPREQWLSDRTSRKRGFYMPLLNEGTTVWVPVTAEKHSRRLSGVVAPYPDEFTGNPTLRALANMAQTNIVRPRGV